MVFVVASQLAARRTAHQMAQRRNMGSGPKPEWTGVDKVVRTYLPEDWQLAAAVLSGYTVLGTVGSMMSGGKKSEEPVAATVAVTTSAGVPAIDSPEFEKYVESDAFVTLLESEDQLTALIGKA
uniref:Uncharacterized protein n=2 Tax=Grammatophora oceanica TaxID=210454 RepID=A0A7S1Y1D6_9STRA